MNIEKTISEHAVSDILTPMLESQDRIVTEDVAPLFDQATGLDTPPASGTVTTTIEESRSVITAIIRKAWTATLTMLGGASVISYIAAAYTYLRNRLQGNETYGIPDRRSEISASSPLAANLALLNDRKIGGVPEAADGMSLVQLMGIAHSEITELTDSTSGWVMRQNLNWSVFPNIKKVTLGCKNIYNMKLSQAEEYYFPNLEVLDNTLTGWGSVTDMFIGNTIKKISMPALKKLKCVNMQGEGFFRQLKGSCEILLPNCEVVDSQPYNPCTFSQCQGVTKIVLGKLTTANNLFPTSGSYGGNQLYDLIHFEIGAGTAISLNMAGWNPTNALDASRTDLIEEGSTAQNNLQQFLENFRDVLFTRLAKRTSTTSLTLTLSPAVYKAVYGLDANYNVDPNALAQTASLADFGITTEDLNEIEIAAGITTATKYATWLDTYRGAIYWNVQHS